VSSVGYPDRNSIAVDSGGNPYISYYDAGKGWLKLAHREGQMWVYEFVDENGSGFTSSLQIAGNAFWLSYSDETRGAVKVARRDMTASESASATAVLNRTTSGVNHGNQ
jgi:hypothetical protein